MTRLTDRESIPTIIQEMSLQDKLLFLTGDSMFFTKAFDHLGIPRTCWLDGGTGFNTMQMKLDLAQQARRVVFGSIKDDTETEDSAMGSIDLSGFGIVAAIADPDKMTPEQKPLVDAFLEMSPHYLPDKDVVGCFPPGMMLGASWSPEVVYSVAEALGREASSFGIDVLLGTPNVNLHRDSRNGRVFEGYSEDPCLIRKLAPEFVKGIQDTGVIANVKHFAANNQETDRMGVDEIISERALRELYLPGFQACVQEGGCKTVMSAYNLINGVACAQNPWLLRQVLRDEWGFDGVVVSDWGAVYDRVESLKSGNDLTMPGPRKIGMLEEAVRQGVIPMSTVDESVRLLLEIVLESPAMKGKAFTTVDKDHSYAAAYQAAVEGMTLLKNDGILPLKPDAGISFWGQRSKKMVASGNGSAKVVTNLGTELFDSAAGRSAAGRSGVARVTFEEITAETDVVVVTVGNDGQEGADRPDMLMNPADAAALDKAMHAAREAGKPVILLLNTSSPVELADVIDDVSAVLCLYLPGMAGGQAAIDALFGDAEPAGRLPLSWPRRYIDAPTALNFPGENMQVMYGEGIFVGYRYYDIKKVKTLFPFGHGLSFTRFSLEGLALPEVFDTFTQDSIEVQVTVKNTGSRIGSEVIQVYLHDEVSTLIRPYKELKAFQKVRLAPGETRIVTLELKRQDFAAYDTAAKQWVVEPGSFKLLAGVSAENILLERRISVAGKNPYGLSLETAIEKIVADPLAMQVLGMFIPDLDIHATLGNAIVFMGRARFVDLWPRFAGNFSSPAEQAAALVKIRETFDLIQLNGGTLPA